MGKAVRGLLPLLVGLILMYPSLPAEAQGEEEGYREDRSADLNKKEEDRTTGEPEKRYGSRKEGPVRKRGEKKGLLKKAVSALGPPTEEIAEGKQVVSPYSTTEEVMLPWEIGALRRKFTTTEPRYFEGRVVEEQAIFESLARQEEKRLYYGYAVRELEKPWWRDIPESLTGVIKYEQGYYMNYFNDRARRHLWTEKPFFGLRGSRWGVLSVDANSFVTLERPSFEHKLSFDPHTLKTVGAGVKLLYRPSRRFHVLVSDAMRKSNKITAVDDRLNQVSLGNNVGSNSFEGQFRYFLTTQDVIDVIFNYDYSRATESGDLRIARGYRPKITFLRAFGRRVILRGFWLHDTLITSNLGISTTTFRQEPGGGGTFVLGKRLVLDVDYSKQFLRPRSIRKTQRGDQIKLRLNHQLTHRLSQSSVLQYAKLEGKRSAISKIGEGSKGSFESLIVASQFNYALTKLTSLGVTLEYTRTANKGSESNNRRRILVEVGRPILGDRAQLGFTYIFNKNNGERSASYVSHSFFLSVQTKFGVGREQ